MKVIELEEALRDGITRYFTGKPCKRGHIAERYTANTQCLACISSRPHNDDMRRSRAVRDQAIAARRLKYFTGRPCRRGHIAERYTRSGACVECLHPPFVPVEREILQAEKSRRDAARSEMIHGRFYLHPEDLEFFKMVVLTKVIAREPLLRMEDIETRRKPDPRIEPMAVYTFWIYAEDRRDLTELQVALSTPREAALPKRPLNSKCGHTYAEAPDLGAGRLRCTKCGEGNYIAPPPKPRKARS